jgi:hypothetical protein
VISSQISAYFFKSEVEIETCRVLQSSQTVAAISLMTGTISGRDRLTVSHGDTRHTT